jgi:hypothetical protein
VVLVNSAQDIDMTCYCFQMQVSAYNATYNGKMKTAAADSPMTLGNMRANVLSGKEAIRMRVNDRLQK